MADRPRIHDPKVDHLLSERARAGASQPQQMVMGSNDSQLIAELIIRMAEADGVKFVAMRAASQTGADGAEEAIQEIVPTVPLEMLEAYCDVAVRVLAIAHHRRAVTWPAHAGDTVRRLVEQKLMPVSPDQS